MKILIADDEAKTRNVLREFLEHAGHQVIDASNGLEAVKTVKEEKVDLIIMDIMMPYMDGITATKEIKDLKDIPIIMLSARGEEYDRLYGFDSGADDYVVKPFSAKEIVARVNAILKRKNKKLLKFEGIEIDVDGRTLFVDKQKVDLTQKEFQLLLFLIKNKGIAISRELILEKVWGYQFYGDDRTIDTHIKMLRNRLGNYKHMLITLRGYGYKFDYVDQKIEE